MTLATWDPVRFRTAYRSCGLTLQQVAVTAGIPYSAVRSYSSCGVTPTAPRLVALAKALRVPTTELAPLREPPTMHELRWHAGLTVAQLAERVRYSVSHTSLVMAGVNPITETERWARTLNVTQREIALAWTASRTEQATRASDTLEAQ